jgi:hypothetical protein
MYHLNGAPTQGKKEDAALAATSILSNVMLITHVAGNTQIPLRLSGKVMVLFAAPAK